MKKTTTRILSLLLALVLLAGVMPVSVQAGGNYTEIDTARVFVHYPMGGQKVNMQGTIVGTKNYTIDFVHFFDCNNGEPVGAFLQNVKFTAGRLYACQICLIPKSGYAFSTSSEVYINGRLAELNQISEDGAFYTVFFTAASGTVTVVFNTCDHGEPHAPIAVPKGGTISDAVADVSTLDPKDLDYEDFVMWSTDPVAVAYSYNAFGYTDQVNADTTLYAHWVVTRDAVDLYVQTPPNCFNTDVGKAIVTVPRTASDVPTYSVEPDFFYFSITDGYLHPDLTYCFPFNKGGTYYSQVRVYTHLAKKLPKVNLYGGTVVSTQRWDDDQFNVIYKVTVPSGSSLTSAAAFVETPKAGQSASTYKPKVTSLSPGLDMTISGWYQNSSCTGSTYTGSFTAGSAYYAKITIGGSNCAYSITANTLSITLRGRNLGLVTKSNAGTNTVTAIVKVTIPKQYEFVVEIPYGGGKVRCASEGPYWKTMCDFTREAGPVTVEARALPGYQFKVWYDANTYEMLSKNQVYTFTLSKNVNIIASFVARRFNDVDCWDYFYEPVMWAVEHGITSGTDEVHFSPNAPCTREQIVTFLWKAKGSPQPANVSGSPFSDVHKTDYFYKAVLWAVQNGITSGTGDGKFGVGMPCTREQAMTFLWKSKGSPKPSSSSNPFGDVHTSDYFYKAVLWAVQNGVTSGTGDGNFGVGLTCTRAQIITFLCKVYGPVG